MGAESDFEGAPDGVVVLDNQDRPTRLLHEARSGELLRAESCCAVEEASDVAEG